MLYFTGCLGSYDILRENTPPQDLKKVQTISVSWINFQEDLWYENFYETKESWKQDIIKWNSEVFQKYLTERLPGKKITFRKPDEPMGEGFDLYIELKFLSLSDGSRSAFLHLMTIFLDKDKKEIYRATLEANMTRKPQPSDYIYNRVGNALYNLALFLYERIENVNVSKEKQKNLEKEQLNAKPKLNQGMVDFKNNT